MIDETLNKELAKKLIEEKGEARGGSIKDNWSAVLHDRGEGDLKKIEDKMAELGYPLKYSQIKATAFYPIGYDTLSTLVMKDLFNLDEKGLEDLGASGVRFSLLFKILLKYFGSLKLVAPEAVKMWKRYYTIGEAEISAINEKEKYVVIRVKNFKVHPVFCFTFRGYCRKVLSMLVGKPVVCQERKCMFQGDAYHEFFLTW